MQEVKLAKVKASIKEDSEQKPGAKKQELLHISISNPNLIQNWKEVHLEENLPEPRSHCCSCVYKEK